MDVGIINNGYLMVELFFVLSGFVIFNAYSSKINSPKDLLRFQFLRFGRLYPVHIIFLFVFLAIEIVKYIAALKFQMRNQGSIPFAINNLNTFIQNIFLFQSVLPNQPFSYNQPAWSISVEFYTYLVFGFIVLFFQRFKIYIFSAIGVLCFVVLIADASPGSESLLLCFLGFFIGCLTAYLSDTTKIVLPNYLPILVFLSIILFLEIKTSKKFDLAIFFLTSALIFSLILSKGGILKKLLNFKLFTWLGMISYSLYMSHSAVLYVVNQFIRYILRRPEVVGVDGKSVPQLNDMDTLIACVLVVALVLLVSQIVYYLVEKPWRDKSRRFTFEKM